MIAVMDQYIAKINDQAKVIPSHGRLSNKAGMKVYRDMIVMVRDRIQKAMADGKDLPAINAMKLTADLDETWASCCINAEFVTRIIYENLKKN